MSVDIVRPVVVPHKDSIMFLAERFAHDQSGIGLRYEIDRGQGTSYQATILDAEGHPLLQERIDIKPTLNAWIADLLARAENGERS